ncbi:MAG: NAD-dependent deacylase [Spirochaetota bacterium]
MDRATIDKLRNAKRVGVLTGAGISQESGVPTFRGKGGYWKNYKAEELATPEAFYRDPTLVWSWYNMRREVCLQAKPNPAHTIVAKMESFFSQFLLITQNVDNLHRRAGNKKIIEIHGNIFQAYCTHCRWNGALEQVPLQKVPPECPVCDTIIRPNIVWFGETYDENKLHSCFQFLQNVEIIIIIGTSGQVSVPVRMAQYAMDNGAFSIEINPDSSALSSQVNVFIEERAGIALPALWEQVNS